MPAMTSQVIARRAAGCHALSEPTMPFASEPCMRRVVTALFVVVALVNLLPVSGALGAARLEALYGMPFEDAGLLLLMRHRAVLFGLVGGLLLVAAVRPTLRPMAATLGLGSMLSFVVLALPPVAYSAAVQRVFWVDVVASLLLVLALWVSARIERR
jgi:hypothetical protein